MKCPKCQFTNRPSATICKNCSFSLTFDAKINSTVGSSNLISKDDVKIGAYKKIKWGAALSILGFFLTFVAIKFGVFEGYSNTDPLYLKLARLFSLISLLPVAALFAGVIELLTGISIFKIIEKWEELPHWLGWLIGIGVFFLIITIILVVAAVIILNFF